MRDHEHASHRLLLAHAFKRKSRHRVHVVRKEHAMFASRPFEDRGIVHWPKARILDADDIQFGQAAKQAA